MPFGLFKKKEGIEEKKTETLEKREVEDLNKLGLGKEITPGIPVPEIDVFRPPEVKKVETPPKPMEVKEEKKLTFDELPLKELCKKIDDELKKIKKELRRIEKIEDLTLESPEMVNLLELYTTAKDKFQEFVDEINKLELSRLSDKTTAAIYKFKACKALADIKKQTQRIESICEKTGLVPSKIQDIIRTRAEDLINSFLIDMQEEKKT
jgi:hypothetical protein